MVSSYQAIRQKMDEQLSGVLEAQKQQADADDLVNKVITARLRTSSSSPLGLGYHHHHRRRHGHLICYN